MCSAGKVVSSVAAALFLSLACPRLVLGLSSFVLVVLLLSLQCQCDALVMSYVCPHVSTYSLCCLCNDLLPMEGFQYDFQRFTGRVPLVLIKSFYYIIVGHNFMSLTPVLHKTIVFRYQKLRKDIGPSLPCHVPYFSSNGT